MPSQDVLFLSLVVGTFVLFGGALGFASWQETRERRRRERLGL
jgi:hypothetical protein